MEPTPSETIASLQPKKMAAEVTDEEILIRSSP
jgi:hypothetical protein